MAHPLPLPDARRVPHPGRLPRDDRTRAAILAAHEAALDAGQPGYVDPATGLFVLTAQALWDQGTCCERGCRHCPWVARPGD